MVKVYVFFRSVCLFYGAQRLLRKVGWFWQGSLGLMMIFHFSPPSLQRSSRSRYDYIKVMKWFSLEKLVKFRDHVQHLGQQLLVGRVLFPNDPRHLVQPLAVESHLEGGEGETAPAELLFDASCAAAERHDGEEPNVLRIQLDVEFTAVVQDGFVGFEPLQVHHGCCKTCQ